MLRIDYKNPMTKLFQYEYVMYMLASDLFADVSCKSAGASMIVDRLKLYYMDLVKVTVDKKTNREHTSYKAQYEMEEEILSLLERDVMGKVVFPGMHMCHAELTVRTREDGSHVFVLSDGIYGFELSVRMKGKGRCAGILVKNYRQLSVESGSAEAETSVPNPVPSSLSA